MLRIDEHAYGEQRGFDAHEQDEECASHAPSVGSSSCHRAYPGRRAIISRLGSSALSAKRQLAPLSGLASRRVERYIKLR